MYDIKLLIENLAEIRYLFFYAFMYGLGVGLVFGSIAYFIGRVFKND